MLLNGRTIAKRLKAKSGTKFKNRLIITPILGSDSATKIFSRANHLIPLMF
jgi:hypothetical protein